MNKFYRKKLVISNLGLIDILIILCGLTAPIGEKMNVYFEGISKAYVFLGLILITFYLIEAMLLKTKTIKKNDKVVKSFIAFSLFVFIHTTVEYILKIYAHNYIDLLTQFKVTIFILISFFLLKSFEKKRKRVDYFIFSFNISFLILFIFFNNFEFANTVMRAEGVYSDSNAFALDALFVVFTSFYLLSIKKIGRTFIILTLIIGAFGIFLSGTRSVFLGIMLGLIFYFITIKNTTKRFKILILLISMLSIVPLIVPKETILLMFNRFIAGDSDASSYSNNIRLLIWKDYLRSWKHYIVFGLDNQLWNLINIRITHNTYLYILVRYGIIGFILYISFIISNIKAYYSSLKRRKQGYLIIFSCFIANLVTSFFIDSLSLKTFWLMWILILYFNSQYRNKLKIEPNES